MDLNFDRVFIVAELSANHGKNKKIAIETIKAAKKAGADAIKLQTYTAHTMTIDCDKKDFLINADSIWDGQNFFKLYEEASTPWEWHEELFDIAKQEDLICFSTPFDRSAVDLLEELNNPIYKIASFEITDIPLIKYIASKQKPIIVSTGIATKNDIDLAIKTIRDQGNNQIALLKCTSSYPAPISQSNLVMIQEFEKEFNVIPGLSDHTLGIIAPVVAVSFGAKIIEKHFILDKSIGGPDASFSLDFSEFKLMVDSVRKAELAIGNKTYKLSEKQKKGKSFSRSLYVIEDVKKGDIISEKNLKVIRPGFGLHPKNFENFLGKKFNVSLEKGTRFSPEFVE